MGLLGRRAANRDIEIGTVLAFMLGVGLLFLSLYKGYANEAYSILFGEILGISVSGIVFTLEASVVVLAVMALIYRRLLFASLDEDVAEAKGLPMLGLGLTFMILLAVAISIAVQVVGVLLIFALMVTPAAIAVRLTKRPLSAVVVSVLVALFATWIGLFVQFYAQYPASFFIVTIAFALYIAGPGGSGRRRPVGSPKRSGRRTRFLSRPRIGLGPGDPRLSRLLGDQRPGAARSRSTSVMSPFAHDTEPNPARRGIEGLPTRKLQERVSNPGRTNPSDPSGFPRATADPRRNEIPRERVVPLPSALRPSNSDSYPIRTEFGNVLTSPR